MATYDNIVTDGLVFYVDANNNIHSTEPSDTKNIVNPSFAPSPLLENQAQIIDGVYRFDGVNDYIELGDQFDFDRTDSFSANAWIKTTKTFENQFIMSRMTSGAIGWGFYVSNQSIFVALYDSISNRVQTRSFTTVTDGEWHNVAFTYEGNADGTTNASGLNIYIDGDLEGKEEPITDDNLTTSISNGATFRVGTRQDLVLDFLGDIAMCSVYDEELSAEEVKKNYEATKHRFH